MTRLDFTIPDRLPNEGLYRLHGRAKTETKQDGLRLQRRWNMIQPALRAVLNDLACAEKPWPLYLHGSVGHGKTRAVLAFHDRIDRAHYWTMDGLMDGVKTEPPWNIWWGGPLELAILDEVGQPRPTDAARDYDYSCLKQFLDWRECRPAIYVSNHPLETIEKLYDTRIKSRLGAGTVYELKDHDRRVK